MNTRFLKLIREVIINSGKWASIEISQDSIYLQFRDVELGIPKLDEDFSLVVRFAEDSFFTAFYNNIWDIDFLSKYEIRFQRQKAIDNFIADFYCHKAKLIIEIDGAQHYTEEGRQKDEFRTEILEVYDLKVIRFTNRQSNTNFSGVCEYIDSAVKASLREGGGPR